MKGAPHYAQRVLYYYCTHLRTHQDVAFVIDISAEMATKLRAIECYRSQFYDGRGPQAGAVVEYVRDTNRFWGRQINREYGEAFAVQETLGVCTPDGLI
jgi:LmbE family N-acetylglucosaminyl deacetylase